jgi:hypothetical protein
MSLVSITQAAQMADLSRPYFHEAYIRTGKISVDRTDPKKPKIDISELMRVFGQLKKIQPNNQNTHAEQDTIQSTQEINIKLELERLKGQNDGLKKLADERLVRLNEKDSLIADTKQEILHYRERINGLEARYDRLLEDKRPQTKEDTSSVPGFWQQLKNIFSS